MRLVLAALSTTLLLTGCVIRGDGGAPPPQAQSPGNITFLWDFEGLGCGAAGIREVQVKIDGERGAEPLQGGGLYPCTFGGAEGVTLQNFAAGPYSFTLEGLDPSRRVIYYASGALQVNGSVERRVILNRVTHLGAVQLFWSFGATGGSVRRACATAGISGVEGVSEINLKLNGDWLKPVACTNGGVDGIKIQDLAPGSYGLELYGAIYVTDPSTRVQQKQDWYFGNLNVLVEAGKTKDYSVVFDPIGAGATFKPLLRDRVTGNPFPTCAAAGVKALAIQLRDKKGAWTEVFWTADCDAVLSTGFRWDYLLAFDAYDESARAWFGEWTARIEAWDQASSTHKVVFLGEKASARVTAGYRDQLFTVDVVN